MFVNSIDILEKMNKNQKINYDNVLKKMIDNWQQEGLRPKILLHSCCAPCSTYTLEYLCKYSDIIIYFANPNIHPKMEYKRREYVQQKFIEEFNQNTNNNIKFISEDYNPKEYFDAVKGLEDELEGGARCSLCFKLRLDKAAIKAKELGCDYFGSALTISPHKNSELINKIGIEVQEIFNVNYLPSDFKKNNGYKRAMEICDEYNVYRQCYCGCIFAAKQQNIDFKKIHAEAKEYLDNIYN